MEREGLRRRILLELYRDRKRYGDGATLIYEDFYDRLGAKTPADRSIIQRRLRSLVDEGKVHREQWLAEAAFTLGEHPKEQAGE